MAPGSDGLADSETILILGAGVAGLAAGRALQLAGCRTLILDASNEAGGLCRTQSLAGCAFDIGPKILLLDASPVRDELLELIAGNYDRYPMQESVYLQDYGMLPFPLQRHLISLPPAVRARVLADLEQASLRPLPLRSYRDWLVNSFGRFFCELVLFPYEEKKWLTDLDDLAFEWALERPVGVTREQMLKGAVLSLSSERGYFYPRHGGISSLTRALGRVAGPMVLEAPVTAIVPERRLIVAGGREYGYSQIVSTIPLDDAVRMTVGLPQELAVQSPSVLRRLSVGVVNLVFDGQPALPGTAIYFPERHFPFRRVTVLRNLCPPLATPGLTSLTVELSLAPDRLEQEESLVSSVLAGLENVEPFRVLGTPLGRSLQRLDFAYPFQTSGLGRFVDKLRKWYSGVGIHHCGRGGSFSYCNIDGAYQEGKLAAAHCLARRTATSRISSPSPPRLSDQIPP